MKASEIRKSFLEFFKSKGHTIVPSASLVPEGDPTLLFTGAGMNQFKEYFLGIRKDLKRAASCQKCLRTLDLDKVGRSAGHHTFFEMLGNFSFGDYFKKEAIEWAWEYFTRVLKIKEEKLWVSVYSEDDESYDIWLKIIKVPKEKIVKLGEVENFWPSDARRNGPNGPCGPCSEIFFDQGKAVGCGKDTCSPACDCGRFVEIWNLVFTQFERCEDGSLKPLSGKNIDTGMGLERIARVMQGVSTNYETDIFTPISECIIKMMDARERKKISADDACKKAVWAISDHLRAVVFLISDGVLPSNEARGYVERMLIRRSARHGATLGFTEPFLYKVVTAVVKAMSDVYPELLTRRDNISQIILSEEKRFQTTLKEGTAHIKNAIHELKKKRKSTIDGKTLFKLYDTYGIPVEYTQEIAAVFKFDIDMAGFEEMLKKQRASSRSKSSIEQDRIFACEQRNIPDVLLRKTKFVGYEKGSADAKVIAVLKAMNVIDKAKDGDDVMIVLDKTPFYAESGGQVGDKGMLEAGNFKAEVYDTKFNENAIVHMAKISKGAVGAGDEVKASVDMGRRLAIARNHTATHLLQGALRQVLGPHVQQAGSLVDNERLRFDFTHFQKLNQNELEKVEALINDWIRSNYEVKKETLERKDAAKKGALAFFKDKYQDKVRVISVAGHSMELCGGIHVDWTGQIGLFRIVNESSISAGARRIEAVCGAAAYDYTKKEHLILEQASSLLKTAPQSLVNEIEKLDKALRDLQKKGPADAVKAMDTDIEGIKKRRLDAGGISVFVEDIKNTMAGQLRNVADIILKDEKDAVCVLASITEGRLNLMGACTKSCIDKGVNCGKLVSDIAGMFGGSGGGSPRLGQGGAKDVSSIDVQKVRQYVAGIINK